MHCEQAPCLQLSHIGPMGCELTAVMTPVGRVMFLSAKTRCGRSLVEKEIGGPLVKSTVALYGSTAEKDQFAPSGLNAWPLVHCL